MKTIALLTLAAVTACGGFDPSSVKAPAVLILQDDTGAPFECVHIEGDDILIVRPKRLEGADLEDLLATTDCNEVPTGNS